MANFKFVEPKAELINERDPLKKIEMAGRTCYKSENNITEDSAKKFVAGLMKNRHTAMVEHATLAFDVTLLSDRYKNLLKTARYLNVTDGRRAIVSGNVRALNEEAEENVAVRVLLQRMQWDCPDLVYLWNSSWPANGLNAVRCAHIVDINTLEDLTAEEIEAHKYLTFRFITDRGVTHEMVRHRPPSYGQESTRYVNYMAGVSICLPAGFYDRPEEVQREYQDAFEDANRHYCHLIEMGQKPQQARAVLPNATKTEIVMTTNIREWNHVWNLRVFGTTGAPHPDIKLVMGMAYNAAQSDHVVAKYRVMKNLPEAV